MSKYIVPHIMFYLPKGGGNMGFFGGYSNGNNGYSNGYGSSFALIVVLFILLIIVGASFFGGYPEGVPI